MLKRFLSLLSALMIFNVAICSATELIIFHTNDMHTRIQRGDDKGNSIGLAEMAAAVKATKAKNPATLWFDAGDTFHGLPLITLGRGEGLVPILNAAGFDAMTAGNHDFQYGTERLIELAHNLNFPLLDANIVYKRNNKLVFPAYKIFNVDGIKVGVFGLTTPDTVRAVNPDNVASINFLNPIEVTQKMIAKLRPKCDVLIAVMHMGMKESASVFSEQIARETTGLDLIVDGHSHSMWPEGIRVKDTLLVQTGSWGHRLGRATIEVKDHKIISKKSELLDADEVKAIAPKGDEKILLELVKLNENVKKILDVTIAHSDRNFSSERSLVRRNESELGNLAADAFRWKSGADIAIVNGGSLRSDLKEGAITRRDLLSIFPFADLLYSEEITGAAIRKMLEHSVEYYPESFGGFLDVSGLTFSYDPTQPAGSRVTEILVNGQPLDEGKIYSITLLDFQRAGGDGYSMLKDLKDIGVYGTTDEIFTEYINKFGIKNSEVGRITRLKEVKNN